MSFRGHLFSLWDSYGLSKYQLRAGSFSQDARGRWYLNVCVNVPRRRFAPAGGHDQKVEAVKSEGTGSVGIDLGLKTAATCSDGETLSSGTYRKYEGALGLAQRANKKGRVRAIHAKVANTRRDALHKFSTKVVARNAAVFVGNIQSSAMVKTKMAKSALDAGWGMLKKMLEYKSDSAGIFFEEVNEAYTTQTCSSCGVIPPSSPKGRAGLRIRKWNCCSCGAEHDRDVNAAKNISARGHARLAGGIPAL